jgi:hypothetical protein
MKITPLTIILMLVTGLLAVWLFIQLDRQNALRQSAMEATQRCAEARFDAAWDSSLGDEGSAQKSEEDARIARLCGEAHRAREDLRETNHSIAASQNSVSSKILQ